MHNDLFSVEWDVNFTYFLCQSVSFLLSQLIKHCDDCIACMYCIALLITVAVCYRSTYKLERQVIGLTRP